MQRRRSFSCAESWTSKRGTAGNAPPGSVDCPEAERLCGEKGPGAEDEQLRRLHRRVLMGGASLGGHVASRSPVPTVRPGTVGEFQMEK